MSDTVTQNDESAKRGTRKRILISDPEPFIRDTLRIKLASKGYNVIPVDSGRDTLRMAVRNDPSLILMEIDYKDVDGLRICQMLKGHTKTAGIPIVILTELRDTPENKFMYSSYVEEFISKPFSPREVARVVDNIVKGRNKK